MKRGSNWPTHPPSGKTKLKRHSLIRVKSVWFKTFKDLNWIRKTVSFAGKNSKIIGLMINIHQYKTVRCLLDTFYFFKLMTHIIVMGWFLYYYHCLRKRVKKRIKFSDVHVISTLTIIYFLKSLLHKCSCTISWKYYNLNRIHNISQYITISYKAIYIWFTQVHWAWRYICLKSQNVSHVTFVHISSVYLIIF